MEYRKIIELKKRAKKGNEKAFEELVKHYEERFVSNVIKNNNDKSLENKAKEKLPILLKKYLEEDYIIPIHDFLRYYSVSGFVDKQKLSDTRKMDIEELKKIYTKRLIQYFNEINNVLTKEELEKFTYNLISMTIDELSSDRDSLATRLGIIFARQKRFVNTEEALLIRYVLQEKYNNNIIEYFKDKYKFILTNYKNEISYIHLNENFTNIIIEVLDEWDCNNVSIEKAIRKKVHKMSIEYTKEINDVGLNIRTDNKRKKELYNANLVLKQRVYELYKDKVDIPMEQMLKIIDKNYDLYFNAYINGVCTKTLKQYILTRFSEYFNRIKLPRQLSQEELEKREKIYLENEVYIDKKMRKLNINYPHNLVRNELMDCYDEAIDTYFRKESKTDFRIIIRYKLKQKIEELSSLYNDDSIINTSLNMKDSILLNKIQNEEIVAEIIDNLTDYYISKKMSNEKPFELFMIDAIENFDLEQYLMIKDVKEHSNLKVLRRPKIK